MATTPATEYTNLADQRVKVKDIEKLKDSGNTGGSGRHTPNALHNKYPFIAAATFTTARTNMNS